MNVNRRKALGVVATAAIALPNAFGRASNVLTPPHGWVYSLARKRKLEINFSQEEVEALDFIRERGRKTHLFGGPVFASRYGRQTRWTNVIFDGPDFSKLKRALFDFGVQPISTLDLRPTFAKFIYKERLFNIVNCDADEFCQTNYMISKENALPFAHNYLVYDLGAKEVYDPYGAIKDDDSEPTIDIVVRPRTLSEAFDMTLAAAFECKLLGLSRPELLNEIQSDTLASNCPESQAKFITERILNYYPEILETIGAEFAQTVGSSNLVNQALAKTLGVSFEETQRDLVSRKRVGQLGPDAGREFMATVHRQIGVNSGQGVRQNQVFQFMMSNDFAIRRPDWISESMVS